MTSTPDTRPPVRGGLGLELLLGALTAFAPLSIDMYLPAFPAIGKDLGVSAASVELTLASFFAGVALGQLLSGPLTDRFGRTRPLYAGLVLYCLGSLGCALAPSAGMLVLWRFIQALGGSVGMVVPRAVVRDLHSGVGAARMMSRLVLVMGVAPILAPLLGGFVVNAFGWRAIFVCHAVAGALALGAVLLALPETSPQRSPMSRALRNMTDMLRSPDFTGYVFTTALAQAGMFAYIAGSAFVFITLHGIPPEKFGWFFGTNAAGLVLSSQINHRILSRFTPSQVLVRAVSVAALAGATLVGAALTGVGGLWGIAVPLFVFVSSLGFINPNAMALALEKQGARAGVASAVLGALQFTLAAGASSAVSAIHDGTAAPMALVVAAAAVLALITLFIAQRATLAPKQESHPA